MYFHKHYDPTNFTFDRPAKHRLTDLGEDVFRLRIDLRGRAQYSQANPAKAMSDKSTCRATFTRQRGLQVRNAAGETVLASVPEQAFGVCGDAWLMSFDVPQQGDRHFYGMGEKSMPLERSGKMTKFWNTDVWADFKPAEFINGNPDPMYLNIPYLIIGREVNGKTQYVGVLVDSPFAVFMSTASDAGPFLGADRGAVDVYVIVGPSLAELTRKLQRLVGTVPLPPLWALGHQQCRWGYASPADLLELDAKFTQHKIPTDGLWLDIDYMDGFRVFTLHPQLWKNSAKAMQQLRDHGRRIVPILDPGVKVDPRYAIYRAGLKADIYCKTAEGKPFVGYVWPGATVFPDYSTQQGRKFWVAQVAKFAKLGFDGAWIDMNDPAVGIAELDPMRFDGGKLDHETYHNQYALGMAQATHEGFLKARPNARPFVLSRSGFTGIARFAANWTGDNYANEHHLQGSVPMTLSLALSGQPFNGPDVCGFGGDTTPELAMAWYKAGFLFPFFRNHTHTGTRKQEPWALGGKALRVIGHAIRLRYKLLPYLYQLFIDQHERGEAILRPLIYDFATSKRLPLTHVGDQFMVGPSIMHAPILSVADTTRKVVLPKARWFDLMAGKFIDGGKTVTATQRHERDTPLYLRDGSLIPARRGLPKDAGESMTDLELHTVISDKHRGDATCVYHIDDGETFDYEKGKRSSVRFTAKRRGATLRVLTEVERNGFSQITVRFVLYAKTDRLMVNGVEARIKPVKVKWLGKPCDAWISEPVTMG